MAAPCLQGTLHAFTAPRHSLCSASCPLQDFAELRKKRRFYARLLDNVAACGFAEPTAVQRQAIPLLMARREVMAVAPTGAKIASAGLRRRPVAALYFSGVCLQHDRD